MDFNFSNVDILIEITLEKGLYQKLLSQLRKDFDLTGINIEIKPDLPAEEIKKLLHEKIYFLLLEKFDEYQNLLYIIDVPEEPLSYTYKNDVVDAAKEITFLILKREFKKVWFRQQYSS